MGDICYTRFAFESSDKERLEQFRNLINELRIELGNLPNGADIFSAMGIPKEAINNNCFTRTTLQTLSNVQYHKDGTYYFWAYFEDINGPYLSSWKTALSQSEWKNAEIEIYCCAEVEGGACFNTDTNHRYFNEKYYIDSYGIASDEDISYEQYFKSEEDVMYWFHDAGIQFTTIEECVEEAKRRVSLSKDDNTYFRFCEYQPIVN